MQAIVANGLFLDIWVKFIYYSIHVGVTRRRRRALERKVDQNSRARLLNQLRPLVARNSVIPVVALPVLDATQVVVVVVRAETVATVVHVVEPTDGVTVVFDGGRPIIQASHPGGIVGAITITGVVQAIVQCVVALAAWLPTSVQPAAIVAVNATLLRTFMFTPIYG